MPANLENSEVATGLENISFHSNSKEGQCKECWNSCTIVLISHASKVMLKILQARLQQYVNLELPDVQARFRKARGTRDQVASIPWIIEKAKDFQRSIYFCFINYAEGFDCVDTANCGKCFLLRNLYAGQEATVRTRHGTMDWFQIWKGVRQDCILSPCLFNLYS